MPVRFVKTSAPVFTVPVPLLFVGKEAPDEVQVSFKPMGTHAVGEWAERSLKTSDVNGLAEIIDGWDLIDAVGAPIPVNTREIAALLDAVEDGATVIVHAYFAGLKDQREGN